ncbi:MAG: AraC family transcriptional regulator [Rhodococcus sp. (in: high G+C Gram-positive bacteria)]|uniref:AraC family transcriptional regulator n=1 Tax=Rhodococcus sp. TaxID=1831 RepID=UPI002AD8F438|nr:AraC family transcriptional regulator [Rhodococcus sp. (in: high G+C Gram-positive bacteria)]
MTGPLARHHLLRTADVDEFCSSASQILSVHDIHRTTTHDPDPFRGQVRATSLGAIELVYLEQGVDMDVDILERLDYYDVMLAYSGTNRIICSDQHTQVGADRGALLSPKMRAKMSMDAEYHQLHLRIDQHVLNNRLENLLGRPSHDPAVFDLTMDLSSPQLSTWMASLRLLIDDLDKEEGLTRQPMAAVSWQEMLLTGLLLSQPHSYTRALHEHDRTRIHRRAFQRALDFCDEHLADPITVGDVAQHIGISARSLQRAFQEELDTSPTRYLHSLRLTRVRQDLLEMDPTSPESVTQIAHRWGFVHLSRFAAAYRKRYGEAPSDTASRVVSEG